MIQGRYFAALPVSWCLRKYIMELFLVPMTEKALIYYVTKYC